MQAALKGVGRLVVQHLVPETLRGGKIALAGKKPPAEPLRDLVR